MLGSTLITQSFIRLFSAIQVCWHKRQSRRAVWILVSLLIVTISLSPSQSWAAEKIAKTDGSQEASAKSGFWNRPQLTGDWGGARTWGENHGLTFDLDFTGFYQGLTSGTGSNDFDSSGRMDLLFNVDTEKLGLWKGGGLRTHTEYRSGPLNPNPGDVMWPVNTGQVLPTASPDEFTVTSLYMTQMVGQNSTVMLGKINVVDLLATNLFYGGGGTRRFMNLAFVAPPTGLVPPVMMGGIIGIRTDPINWTLMVYDPHDRTRDYLPGDLFSDGVNLNLSATYSNKLAGRTTTYGLGGIYSTQRAANLRDTLLPPDLVMPTESGSYNVNVQFTHLLYEYKNRPGDGWGIFIRGGFSDGNPNPIQTYISGGIGGKGLFASRPNDNFGIGYFYYNFSDELKSGLRPALKFGDEQGSEIFYSFAVTPWFHLSADLQVINPAISEVDTAVIGALRMNIRF